jgi:hypothetical protein
VSRRARSRAAAVAAKHVALAPLPEREDDDDPELEGWYACPSCGADTDPHTEDECWHCGEAV